MPKAPGVSSKALVEKFLRERMGFSSPLIYIAEVLMSKLEPVDDDKLYRFEKAILASKELMPEVAVGGIGDVGRFCRQMPYDWVKSLLLESATRTK